MALKRRAHTQPLEQSEKKALTSRMNAPVASKVSDVSLPGAAGGADLGGSSKYSSETLEGQCGEGFHVNSS